MLKYVYASGCLCLRNMPREQSFCILRRSHAISLVRGLASVSGKYGGRKSPRVRDPKLELYLATEQHWKHEPAAELLLPNICNIY